MKPHFPSFDFSDDVVDDYDDCIICKKMLLNHSEVEANACYNKLFKRKLVKSGGSAIRP